MSLYDSKNIKLRQVLIENDRHGERAIAWFQALIAVIVFGFHIVSASKNQWASFSLLTISLATCIFCLCALRLWLASRETFPATLLNALTIVDGCVIFALIISYSYAYDLPVESSFKAPSIIFLVLYAGSRVLRLDPIPILVAGTTVVLGWLGLLLFCVFKGAHLTNSYEDHVETGKLLIGANIEMAVGFIALTAALVATSVYARRILANTADIEELENATRQAEEIAARHAALFRSSSDGILVVDRFGIVEQVNPALETMFGRSASDLIGNSVAVLMSMENAQKLAGDIEAFQNNAPTHLVGKPFESEGIHAGGYAFPIELSISHFMVVDQLRFTGIVRDITGRVHSQQRERAAHTKFEEVVTSALDAIVVIDENGIIVEFNPAAEAIFGFRSEQVIGKDMGQTIIPAHHREAHAAGMKNYLTTGVGKVLNQRIEIDAITADQRPIMIELAIKEWANEDGSLFFGYMRDITEKKAKEQELIEAKERAEVANRAKASFLAMMSHEIRTPLNGVLGILTLLSESVKQPENIKLIATARRSGRSLLTIINDILDFSKLEAGKLELEKGSFHVDLLVDGVQSLVRQQANQKSLKLEFSISERVPKILYGDQDRIRQVLLNLVWNAIKFTPEGRIDVTLENAGSNLHPNIRFLVSDTGIGVPEDRQHELFAEFATIDPSYARKFGGTGLGLSICKALTDSMNGTIGYTKNDDLGSTFWFELPLEEGDENAVKDEDGTESAAKAFTDLGSIRLLLAEDNGTNQLVVGNMLERLGCIVDIVSNGQEAVDGVLVRDYDAVLMDVSMPEMDGITATKIIRSLDSDASKTPIIALTAYALDDDRQRVLAAGMNDFVAKPVSKAELTQAIARQVTAARGNQQEISVAEEVEPLINAEILNGILEDMDDLTGARIIVELERDISRHLNAMIDSVSKSDSESFEKATHGLKGVSGTFGATQLSRVATLANITIRNQETKAAFNMAEEIESIALATLNSVHNKFGSPKNAIESSDA